MTWRGVWRIGTLAVLASTVVVSLLAALPDDSSARKCRKHRACLKRHDAPPRGAQGSVRNYFGIGDPICSQGASQPGMTYLVRWPIYQSQRAPDDDPARPEIGESLLVCIQKADRERSVRIRIHRPDGRLTRRTIRPSRYQEWIGEIFIGIDWPTGRYKMHVSQGSRRQTRTFTVTEPTHYGVRTTLDGVVRGNSVPVAVVGLPANSTAMIDVFRLGGEKFRYVTDLHLRTNAAGRAQYRLRTSRDDPPGLYLFTPRAMYDFEPTDQGYPEEYDAAATLTVCARPC